MGELATIDNAFDGMLEAVKSGNTEDLMKLTGQGDEDVPKQGLSRMNINYTDETDEGIALKKGVWKMYYEGEFVYADKVDFRALMRTYEWSVWDQDEGKFASRSVQAPSLEYQFPDTTGGFKCGRLTKSEEEQLGEDHPSTLASRLATCNQVFYAVVSMDGKTADGTEVQIKDYPVMTYFKKSGFRPAREAIQKLDKKPMQEVVFELTTKRNKQGSVVYYTPVFTRKGEAKLDEATFEMIEMFKETIKASNNNILNQHKEALKAKASEEEVDLAADFQ